jgi:hypothetical protein
MNIISLLEKSEHYSNTFQENKRSKEKEETFFLVIHSLNSFSLHMVYWNLCNLYQAAWTVIVQLGDSWMTTKQFKVT